MADYLQILAKEDFLAQEGQEDTAKDLLAVPNEQEHETPAVDHHPDELEDQEAFQKFGGSRQIVEVPTEPLPTFEDRTKISVRQEKDVKTHVFNIDSRQRANQDSSLTHFIVFPDRPFKNIISARVSSLEIPNTFYSFSDVMGNRTMKVTVSSVQKLITITAGNQESPADLALELENQLNAQFSNFTVSFNMISGKITIANTSTFSMKLDDGIFGSRSSDWGLGYSLGYRKKSYSGQTSQTGESIADVVDEDQLQLTINDQDVMQNAKVGDVPHITATAKVIVTVPKNGTIQDNGSNTVTKEQFFMQPKNVYQFEVQLRNAQNVLLDMEGVNWSCTVELKEILNPSLYETMRDF